MSTDDNLLYLFPLPEPSKTENGALNGPDRAGPTRVRGGLGLDGSGGGHGVPDREALLRLVPVPTGDRDWRSRASCVTGMDPVEADKVFFPEDEAGRVPAGGWDRARELCAGCPVAGDCLTAALESEKPGNRWGMVAGFTPDERDVLTGSMKTTEDLVENVHRPASGGGLFRCPDCQQAANGEHVCPIEPAEHGTRMMYNRHGCRCEACCTWNRRRRQGQATRRGHWQNASWTPSGSGDAA